MKWAVDYTERRKGGESCWKRKIVEGNDIADALECAKNEICARWEKDKEIEDGFIYTIDLLAAPEDIVTVEEVEDED